MACREFWAPGVLAQGFEAEAAVWHSACSEAQNGHPARACLCLCSWGWPDSASIFFCCCCCYWSVNSSKVIMQRWQGQGSSGISLWEMSLSVDFPLNCTGLHWPWAVQCPGREPRHTEQLTWICKEPTSLASGGAPFVACRAPKAPHLQTPATVWKPRWWGHLGFLARVQDWYTSLIWGNTRVCSPTIFPNDKREKLVVLDSPMVPQAQKWQDISLVWGLGWDVSKDGDSGVHTVNMNKCINTVLSCLYLVQVCSKV